MPSRVFHYPNNPKLEKWQNAKTRNYPKPEIKTSKNPTAISSKIFLAISRHSYHFENPFRHSFINSFHSFAFGSPKMLTKCFCIVFESSATRSGHLGYPKRRLFLSYHYYPKLDKIENTRSGRNPRNPNTQLCKTRSTRNLVQRR